MTEDHPLPDGWVRALGEMSAAVTRKPRKPKTPACTRCGLIGHLARTCPRPTILTNVAVADVLVARWEVKGRTVIRVYAPNMPLGRIRADIRTTHPSAVRIRIQLRLVWTLKPRRRRSRSP